ncbi:MAG: hypothetical protein ACR2MS_12765, partial [Weeksellaceae bacterium]
HKDHKAFRVFKEKLALWEIRGHKVLQGLKVSKANRAKLVFKAKRGREEETGLQLHTEKNWHCLHLCMITIIRQ